MRLARPVAIAAAGVLLSAALSGRQIVTFIGDMPGRSAAPPPKGTGFVMGRAVDADSGAPIADATVTLSTLSFQDRAAYESVVTDTDGRFVVRDLPKAAFHFYVVKAGYVPGAYTKRLPVGLDDAGAPLALGEDEHIGDVTIKMWKYAVIEGSVTDETGDPVVDVAVRALPRRVVAGRTQFALESAAVPFGSYAAQTDDRGMYRLSMLPPGDYIVAVPVIMTSGARTDRVAAGPPGDATSSSSSGLMTWTGGNRSGGLGTPSVDVGDPRFALMDPRGPASLAGTPGVAGFSGDGHLLVYETQFFPGTPALGRATPISLGSGATRSGVDFRLRPMPAMKISGSAARPEGPAAGVTLRLVSAEMSATSSDPEVAITTTDTAGRFVFLGVTPGQYAIRALDVPRARSTPSSTTSTVQTAGGSGGTVLMMSSGTPTPIPDAPVLWTDTPVSVGERDVADVAVTLRPGVRISGHVEFEGTAERPDVSTRPPSVMVMRADGQRAGGYSPIQSARIDADWRLTTYGQVPGQYVLQVSSLPKWHLAGAFVGGRDVSILPLDLSGKDVDDLVIRFTDTPPASITGVVTNARAQPDETASVIVFPADRRLWTNSGPSPRNLRSVGTSRGGRYTVDGLPAGDYLVAAVTELPITWADPRTLESLAPAAAHVTLRGSGTVAQDLRAGAVRGPVAPDAPILASAGRLDFFGATWSHGPFVDDELQTARDAGPVAATGTGRIGGIVAVDGKAPAARAHVTLAGVAAFGSRTIITTETGRFEFPGLPPGRYTLNAGKPAYLGAIYGESRIGGAGTTISLADGQQLTGITLAIHKASVITGVIRDERGQPMPGATVSALQYRAAANGERRLFAPASGSTRTDDRGVYRIYSLAPGEYYVSATANYVASNAHPTSTADIQFAQQALQRGLTRTGAGATAPPASGPAQADHRSTVRYVAVLYPGVTSPDGAQSITLGVAEERTDVDFPVRLVPTVWIEGAVTNAAGPLPPNVDVRLIAVGVAMPSSGLASLDTLLPVRPGPDGRFVFTGIAPGQYVVAAMTQPPTGRAGRGGDAAPAASGLWATAAVNVNGVDVSNVALTLQPGMTVSGKVRFNATTLTAPADLSAVRVYLSPVLTSGQVAMGQNTVSAASDGSFVFTGLTPGPYNLRAMASGWLMTSVSAGGHDAIDMPFEIRAGENVTDASIAFGDRPAEIGGVLQDASGRPATDYYVILMPADPARWKSPNRRVQQVRPSSDGRFTFRNLLPGDYLVGATTDVEIGATADPAFLTGLSRAAVKVALAEGEKKVQDLRIGK